MFDFIATIDNNIRVFNNLLCVIKIAFRQRRRNLTQHQCNCARQEKEKWETVLKNIKTKEFLDIASRDIDAVFHCL